MMYALVILVLILMLLASRQEILSQREVIQYLRDRDR